MSKGVNWTAQRRAVFDIVQASPDHPTANEIMERLKASGHRYAYATVYNALRYLTEKGLLREVKIGESASRYDANTHEHVHVVCDRCGAIAEFERDLPGDWMSELSRQTGYRVVGSDLVFHGICPACQARDAGAELG
ncbi:Fur family transcriptional regulator [Alicyclobacillus fructus]|uniref:Fur family transcriptional regulator n=1 Tax=Alicyclobacillus fructus TaxID=2816082 RepID=UPI001A8D62EE|nr:transcriptional repressor [Alicyclobacillus fructus]